MLSKRGSSPNVSNPQDSFMSSSNFSQGYIIAKHIYIYQNVKRIIDQIFYVEYYYFF